MRRRESVENSPGERESSLRYPLILVLQEHVRANAPTTSGLRTPPMLARLVSGLSPRCVFQRYSSLLVEMPLRTKTATSFTIAACGDVFVQSSSASTSGPIDLGRTARQASFSMLMAPTAHIWYNRLARYPPAMAVLIDQMTFAPVANVLYLGWSFALREKTLQGCTDELRAKLWPATKASYLVWPASLLFNFSFVPLRFRVLFTNFVGFFYGAWMSFLANDFAASPTKERRARLVPMLSR